MSATRCDVAIVITKMSNPYGVKTMNRIATLALIATVAVGAGTAAYAVSAPSTVAEAIISPKVLAYNDDAGLEGRRSD